MADRTSSMGGKTMLARLLSLGTIAGSLEEIANAHEINRQSAVKQILVHVFFMSKFDIIDANMTVGKAESQYFRATGDNEAAHCSPGQILHNGTPIQKFLTLSEDLQITVENLFGKTDNLHKKFNQADSRAEENGLRRALLSACSDVARAGKTIRFNRVFQIYGHLSAAFGTYRSQGLIAYQNAILRQRTLIREGNPSKAETRRERIAILECYAKHLRGSSCSIETVLGLFPEDIWREYASI